MCKMIANVQNGRKCAKWSEVGKLVGNVQNGRKCAKWWTNGLAILAKVDITQPTNGFVTLEKMAVLDPMS